jgi:hypothetical protein
VHFFLEIDTQLPIDPDDFIRAYAGIRRDITTGIRYFHVIRDVSYMDGSTCHGGSN